VPFQNHQKAVRSAFVQLEQRGNLRQTLWRIALAKQIQNGECPVKGLNFVSALRRSVSHYGSPFCTVIYYKFAEIGTICQVLIRDFSLWEMGSTPDDWKVAFPERTSGKASPNLAKIFSET
jgi:hypothetical protein